VAAVGRRVVFRDPRRFAAALYDEAWALLASPHGQNLLIEGVRDGRKHNGAIWLASQHPNDFAISELEDLLGSRFVFRQARRAIPAALRFLGVTDSVDAAVTLEQGLTTGVCLYRDVRDRVGLIQVLPPTLPEIDAVFDTSPSGGADAGRSDAAELELDDDPDALGYDDDGDDLGELVEYTGRLSSPPELGAGQAPPGEDATGPAAADLPAAPTPPGPPPATDQEPAAEPPRVEVIEPEPVPVASAVRSGTDDAAAEARRRARRRRRTPLAQALADGEER
jgi:hypothetical protein